MIWSVHIPSSDMKTDRVLRSVETCGVKNDLNAVLFLTKSTVNQLVKRVGFLVH